VNVRKALTLAAATAALSVGASAQIPDLLTALDAGGRAMGLGGATYVTDSTTYSALMNPAGLGFISRAQYGVSYRNLPESRSVLSGDANDPDYDTTLDQGAFGLTHVGYAFPMGRGAVGVSYTRTGFIRDESVGGNLADGGLTRQNYQELFRSQTDLFTLSYGASSNNGGTNYGVGLVVAQQYINNTQDYDLFNGNVFVGSVSTDNSGNGLGFGLVAGMMTTVGANTSFGLSAQSPIDLSGNAETSGYLDRIPGRITAGIATRNDNNRGEYTLLAAQASQYFGGQKNKVFSRDSYTVLNLGFEYGLNRWNARVPVRFGYTVVPDGGGRSSGQHPRFQSRDAFTFGVGYRPNGSEFSLDLSFAKPIDGNSFDLALALTYLLGR
jgi:hypothetical protein